MLCSLFNVYRVSIVSCSCAETDLDAAGDHLSPLKQRRPTKYLLNLRTYSKPTHSLRMINVNQRQLLIDIEH